MAVEGKEAAGEGPRAGAVSHIEVGEEEAGQRLDNFLLARLKGVPKSRVYKVIRGGEVRVNSGRVEASYCIAAGDGAVFVGDRVNRRVARVKLVSTAEETRALP